MKTAVLLVNLGTPEAPTKEAVRPYLKEFLSDRKVVEIPRIIWWPILNGIILNTRPRQSAAKYAKIWTEQGSPLKVHTEKQTRLLQEVLGEGFAVQYAMRYGNPSIESRLEKIEAQKILVVPLYPQFAASSAATVIEEVQRCAAKLKCSADIKFVRDFHNHPAYIAALSAKIKAFREKNGSADRLVMSFHGVPQYTVDKGDPYQGQCLETGRLLAESLDLAEDQYLISFQSRFGRTEWIKPYTAEVVQKLGEKGEKIDVVCPGFVSDCLETLEEIDMEVRDLFLKAGGKQYRYLEALNEDPLWISALAQISLSAS